MLKNKLAVALLCILCACGKDCTPKKKCLKSHIEVTMGPDMQCTHSHIERKQVPEYGLHYHFLKPHWRWELGLVWKNVDVCDQWAPVKHEKEICDEWSTETYLPEGCR